MKSKKTTDSSRIEHAVGRAVDYEITVADLARKSERRAWRVAGASIAMSLILAGGYFYMLPLKQKVPYLIMADASSGTATVARITGNLGETMVGRSEAVNRSNVAHYVQSREAYDIALLNIRDWTIVYTMSSPEVAQSYTAVNSSSNPQSPLNIYGRDKAIRVQINSIQMIGGENGGQPKGATVRFQRTLYDKTNGWTDFLDNRIATMMFTYKNLVMTEQQRIENPLGFQVTSYRVDQDFSVTPPPANPAPRVAPAPTAAVGNEQIPAALQAPQPQGVPGSPVTAPATPMPAQPTPVQAPGVPAAPVPAPATTTPNAQGAAR